jgi:outer membrane immunogenic protein
MRINVLAAATSSKTVCGIAAAAVGGAVLLASPVQAQSYGDGDEFTGFRIEALGGWDNEGVDFDDDVFDGGKRSDDGFMLGGAIGYDLQMGQFVIGAEGEFTESTLDREYQEQVTLPPTPSQPIARPISTIYNIEGGGDIAVAARAGYVVSPAFMIYGKVGYSWHKLAIEGTGTDNGSSFVIDEALDLAGLRLGAGGEMNFTDMFFGKIEYRYSNYNEGDFDVRGFTPTLEPLFSGIDVVRHQVVVGAGLRF